MPELLVASFLLLSVVLGLVASLILQRTRYQTQKNTLKLMKEVFDHTHDGVTITDPDGKIIAVNRTFTQVTGYSEAEVLGQNPRILSSGYHDAAFYEAYWQGLMRDGIWQGEIWNRRKDGEVYLEWLTCKVLKDTHGRISHYVAIFTDITEHRRQEARLEKATDYDRLTGLPNTGLFLRSLAKQPPSSQRYWCMVLIDIDNFRLVNASYGFSVGDQLLANMAKRLREICPGVMARHSADVFIWGIPLEATEEDTGYLQQIHDARQSLARPFSIKGRLMEFNFSMGATLWTEETQTVSRALQEAELALHAAKNRGAGQLRFYSEDLKEAENPLILLQALRDALAAQQLSLHYQPLVCASSGKIHAFEVLMRWQHPTLGAISPAQFIPLAERHGLMEQLGQWTLDQSLKQYAVWEQEGIAPARIAVNVSPLEFAAEGFVEQVSTKLKRYQLSPHCLELELTEGVFVQRDESTLERLDQLAKMGIRLAIDDFGTGYSSLAYLKHLPVNQLKLDRSFIQGLPHNKADQAIVESTLALCKGLKMQVVAEGVETSEQAAYLSEQGCDLLQGFYFGRPQDTTQTTQLLRQNKQRATQIHCA
ncbi:putative bifunctional diguanylate cyclase/phosphodiesterase [Marinospirillum sp.]|uniref:putative bifunctional diguanylate cyclase/phosphodiesterase n=1 Tax=Marinospirillum sp. TaxID=2183934 RepID=UPI003A8B8BD6